MKPQSAAVRSTTTSRSKTDLFQATFEQVEDELTAQVLQVAAAGGETDPMRILQVGFGAVLDQCLNPEVQRIVMLDGPTVLGWICGMSSTSATPSAPSSGADRGCGHGTDRARHRRALHPPVAGCHDAGRMVVARPRTRCSAKEAMTDTFPGIVAGL